MNILIDDLTLQIAMQVDVPVKMVGFSHGLSNSPLG